MTSDKDFQATGHRLAAMVLSTALAVGSCAMGTDALAAGASPGSAARSEAPQLTVSSVLAPQTTRSILRLLVGHWLGAFPAPPGACGYEYAEWFLYGTRSYTLTWNSYHCGGSTSYGRYSVRGDLLTFHQQSVPGCPTCVQTETIPVTFRFVTSAALRFCNYPAGACYMYYRQR